MSSVDPIPGEAVERFPSGGGLYGNPPPTTRRDPWWRALLPWFWLRGFLRVIHRRRYRALMPRHFDPPPVVNVPIKCPRCFGRIELASDFEQAPDGGAIKFQVYRCCGLATRAEMLKYLAPELPSKSKLERDIELPREACGWSGRADEFGQTWY